MKSFINTCWLFQKERDPLWPRRRLRWYTAWRLIALLGMSVCWGAALLVLAAGSYPKHYIGGYFETPLIAALNILPVLVLSLLFYVLFNRAWAAFLCSGVLTLGFSLGNYYLLLFRDDPLMAADLLDLSTGLGFTGRYDLSLDVWAGVVVLCFFLALGFLCLFARGRGSGVRLRLLLLGVLLAAGYPLFLLYRSDTVYEEKAVNFRYFIEWSDTQRYAARGFLYPFLHSIGELFPAPPAGYDEAEAAASLAAYTDEDIPADKAVDLVVLQLEAFSDLTRLGVGGFDESVYDGYHALEKESYTGDLVTNIFAGGTVDTERCCITGTAELRNYRSDTNSYAWWLQTQGYTVEGSHPCYDWFYNRLNVNRYLGLTNYHYYEDYYMPLASGGLTTDAILFDEIANLLDAHAASSDAPYFSFNVSYQNHGPYDSAASRSKYVTGNLSDESRNILNNYLAGVASTSEALKALRDRLADSEEPVVLLVFGDHKPWLGYGNSVYTELGVDFDLSTEQGLLNYYGTRYLLWANDAAKAILGDRFTGEGPTLSSNFLLNELFDRCGYRGCAFMQLAEATRRTVPVVTSTGFYLVNGQVETELTGASAEAVRRYTDAAYWWRENFLFEEK